MVDNKCPGCEEKRKTKSNTSGGKRRKKFGKRKVQRAFDKQEMRKLEETSVPRIAENGGIVLGFDHNNLKTSNFKNKNK